MTKPPCIFSRRGFTLVELMVVIAIMAILAAVGAAGTAHLVPAYQSRACEEERTQAVRAFVSDWLETRQLAGASSESLNEVAEKWLNSYLQKTQVNCRRASENWEITLTAVSGTTPGAGYIVTLACKTHDDSVATAAVGQTSDDPAGGIRWDGGFVPPNSGAPSPTPEAAN